jgi:hypothetical protein
VRGFDSRAEKNKNNQQQTEPTGEIGVAVVGKSKHAGLMRLC